MDSYNQEEFNRMTADKKIDIMITNVEKAVDSKDETKIKQHINEMMQNIKNLMSSANKDKITYIVIQYLNKIVAASPTIRAEACQLLHENINKALDNIQFEKQSLIELKKYLLNCKQTKDYSDLATSFCVLICLLGMQGERIEQLRVDADIWKCGINGIKYIPKTQSDAEENFYRECVEKGIRLLQK